MPTAETPVTVVHVNDSLLVGEGMASLLRDESGISVVGQVDSIEEMIHAVDKTHPAVVVLSVAAASDTLSTVSAARRMREGHPNLGLVVIADAGEGLAVTLLRDGASRIGFLLRDHLHDMSAVVSAIREVAAGQTVLDPMVVNDLVRRHASPGVDDLTPRETEVLEQISLGRSNRAIAEELSLSMKSVEKHITAIFRKLDLVGQPAIDRRVMAALVYLRAQDRSVIAPDLPASPS